jgi:hypothetical protein
VAADVVERGSELGWCLGLGGRGQRDEHLRTNADDRLPLGSLDRVEGGLPGLAALPVAADQMVLGAARLAAMLRISPVLVGVLVIGLGT